MFTASTAQLVTAPASDAFGGWFTSRPDYTHTKDFNYEIIYLWHKNLNLLQETSNLSLLFSKTKEWPKKSCLIQTLGSSATESLQKLN